MKVFLAWGGGGFLRSKGVCRAVDLGEQPHNQLASFCEGGSLMLISFSVLALI